ncbi:MAG: SIS domain-containing protein [Chloroflexi bacterium]|nr:SIS domain-containing protein [Chloroflexota bacterium]MCL5075975.1 SIS domain-containing protein [Chloroflexota bacterium]
MGPKYVLREEIFEQPRAIAATIAAEATKVKETAEELRRRDVHMVIIAGRGSSDNAAIFAKYLFESYNRWPVALAAPSLYTLYKSPPRLQGTLVIAVSQSGESVDILEVTREARRQGACTLAITNEPHSPLAGEAAHVLLSHAGRERSIAATKTYTTQLTLFSMLSAELCQDEEMWAAIRTLPTEIEKALSLEERLRRYAGDYRHLKRCLVISRGYNYATAFEIALKIKETSYILAQPYSAADFLHGPIAIVEPGLAVIMVAPRGRSFANLMEVAKRLRERGVDLIVLSDSEEMLSVATTPVHIALQLPEALTPLPFAVLGQLFAFHLAVAKGFDPDHPRELRKITITE